MNTFASSSCTRYHFISDARKLRRFADIIVEYVVFIWMDGTEVNSKCSTTEFLTHHIAVESYCIAKYPTRGPSKNVTCGQSYHIVVDIPIFEDWLKRYYRYWKVMQDTREMSVFQFYYLTKRWGKKNIWHSDLLVIQSTRLIWYIFQLKAARKGNVDYLMRIWYRAAVSQVTCSIQGFRCWSGGGGTQ